MKLADWARKQGIAYLTAYRWFKDGKLPAKSYQSTSGTIIVEDEDLEQSMQSSDVSVIQSDDAINLFIKSTIEFSKNCVSLEDFAAYILSNFTLKIKSSNDIPRYSKNKPKSEDIQKHFQQFIKKGEKPKPNAYVVQSDTVNEIVETDDELLELCSQNSNIDNDSIFKSATHVEVDPQLFNELSTALSTKPLPAMINTTDYRSAEGKVRRLELTPQNYTNYTEPTFSDLSPIVETVSDTADSSIKDVTDSFKPTQQEIAFAKYFNKNAAPVAPAEQTQDNLPRRRGRKSHKNLGK